MTIYVQYIWDNGEDEGIFSSEEDDFIEDNLLWTLSNNDIETGVTDINESRVRTFAATEAGNISYQKPFTSFTITLLQNAESPVMTVKGIDIDLFDVTDNVIGMTPGLINDTTYTIYVKSNGIQVHNETEDKITFYNGTIDNNSGIVISFSGDEAETFLYSYFYAENIFYPEIETLWINNGSTSVAKHSNNYLIGRSWVDGLSFKINTDNIKVESYEQVFNTVNIHVTYQEVENV